MGKLKKSFVSVILAFLLVIQLVPLKAFAINNISVNVIIENNTFTEAVDGVEPPFTGTIVDTNVIVNQGDSALAAVNKALEQEGIEYKATSSGYVQSIKGLGEFDGGEMSGWMCTVNDWFINESSAAYEIEDNDQIRFMYTTDYGEDLGGSWSNNDKSLKSLKTSVGKLTPAFSTDVKEYKLQVPKGTKGVVITPTAVNKNFMVKSVVNGVEYKRLQTVPVSNGTVISVKCGDPSWPSMNNQAGGDGSSIPAVEYKLTVEEVDEVIEDNYKMQISVDPKEGGTVDILSTKYDEDYNDESTEEKGITSKSINVADYDNWFSDWKLVANPSEGYVFKGWKIGDKIYGLDEDIPPEDTGGLICITDETGELYIFNYDDEIINMDSDLNISAVFEKSTSNKETLENFISKNLNFYKMRPQFGTDTNIVTMFNNALKKMDGSDGITATLKSTDDASHISEDGDITYFDNFDFSGFASIYQANVGLTFSLNLNGESVDFSTTALVGWDADKVKAKMEEEIATLTEEKMKGENTDLQNVQSNLVLPQILGNSYKLSLSQISWTSSNTDVISIKNGDGYAYPDYVGQVTQPAEDTEVTLTATFKFNKTNSAIEKDIILKKEYKVLVKAKTVDEEQIKKEMLEELNSKYTESLLKDFNTKEVLDVNNVTGDIQLPVPSRIGLVNKEIKVTSSDESLLKINGYRAYTYQPIGEDKKIDLIITMTRDSISVEKRIPLTIKQGSQEEIKNEIKLMEEVKKHYFDGINDGRNIDADNIVQNLHAFKEVSFNEDGTLSWVYNINDATGEGIEPVDIDPSDQMGIGGYRLFYTSNNSVINYENLLVNRPEKDTKVIIKSVLSSKKFAKYAQMYPDNEDLQKLYRQEVQVEVTVKGTKQSNKVTFDDGNSNTENIVKEVNEGDVLDYTPQAPTKEGYTFVGWYLDIDNTTTEYKSGQTYSEDVTYKAKYAHVEMTGAQAKAIVNEKSGIRFGTKLYNDGDEIIEKGTLIIPKNLLADGQKLNLDTKKVAKSVGKNIYESNEEENYVTYLGTLLNIPKSQFGREITAASYVTYKDKAGNEYTVYAPYKNGATTVNNLLGL